MPLREHPLDTLEARSQLGVFPRQRRDALIAHLIGDRDFLHRRDRRDQCWMDVDLQDLVFTRRLRAGQGLMRALHGVWKHFGKFLRDNVVIALIADARMRRAIVRVVLERHRPHTQQRVDRMLDRPDVALDARIGRPEPAAGSCLGRVGAGNCQIADRIRTIRWTLPLVRNPIALLPASPS